MPIAVTGSIATDHLTHLPGPVRRTSSSPTRSTASRCPSWSTTSSSSAAGSPATSPYASGARPRAAPRRCRGRRLPAEYRTWLTDHGVDCTRGAASATTCRPPASCARRRRHAPDRIVLRRRDARAARDRPARRRRARGLDIALIGANDPDGMLRHTAGCREFGFPFAADPSQQLAGMDGPASASSSTAPATCSATTTSGSCCCRRPAGPRPRSRSASTSGSPPTARRASRSPAAAAPP